MKDRPQGGRVQESLKEEEPVEPQTMSSNGAEAVLETLRRWGVRRLFICPGSTEVALLDASFAYPDVELVLATHESSAVAMADGYARASGSPGVAYLHTNVGLTNGLSHLHAAQVASSPVVVPPGQKATAIHKRRAVTSSPYLRDHARPAEAPPTLPAPRRAPGDVEAVRVGVLPRVAVGAEEQRLDRVARLEPYTAQLHVLGGVAEPGHEDRVAPPLQLVHSGGQSPRVPAAQGELVGVEEEYL
jgi:hypothetical protein